jgi:hypothetical protein
LHGLHDYGIPKKIFLQTLVQQVFHIVDILIIDFGRFAQPFILPCNWAKENKRPFTMEEFPSLISKAVGVDLNNIYQKWQKPIE